MATASGIDSFIRSQLDLVVNFPSTFKNLGYNYLICIFIRKLGFLLIWGFFVSLVLFVLVLVRSDFRYLLDSFIKLTWEHKRSKIMNTNSRSSIIEKLVKIYSST